MIKRKKGRVIVFGEVLFDCFPDAKVVMGGAPLNVAWHLQGFGLDPLLISRLGDDAHAASVLNKLENWGLDTSGIQRDINYPTGQVAISLNNGQPEFNILENQAYDYIELKEVKTSVKNQNIDFLYHGSLVARNGVSLESLLWLRNKYKNNIFLDINLRAPWWGLSEINNLISGVQWLKLNDDELLKVANEKNKDLRLVANKYKNKTNIQNLIITLGEKGAFILQSGNLINGETVKVPAVVDTVGAGDAFSSVLILSIMHGWDTNVALSRALEFAALICTQRGATIINISVYKKLLEDWGL